MEFLLTTIFLVGLYIYSGVGISILVTPKGMEKYIIFLSPFIGLIYLSLCSWFFFLFSSFGIESYAHVLLIPPIIFIFLGVLSKNNILKTIITSLKGNIPLIILGIIIFSLIAFPYYSKIIGLSSTITLGNNDIADYAMISKYLMASSNLSSPIPYVAETSSHFTDLLLNNYFSAFVSTAVPSTLFCLEPYQLENLLIYLFFVFILPIIYIIGREIIGYSQLCSLIVTLMVGINFHLVYMIYHGFLGQVIGMGMFLCLFLFTYYPIINYKKFCEYLNFLPINCIFFLGLAISYQILLPLFLLPLFIFIIIYWIKNRSKEFLIQSLSYISLTLGISFIISPPLFINRIQTLIFYKNVVAGWNLPIITPERLFGILGNDVWMQCELIPFRLIFSLIIIIFFLFSFYQLYSEKKPVSMIFGINVGLVIIYYSYLVINEYLSPEFSGEGYKAYKLLTYFIPLIIICGFYAISQINLKSLFKRRIDKYILLIIVILIFGNIWSFSILVNTGTQLSIPINPTVKDLSDSEYLGNIDSVNVDEPSWWDQMWIYYFLFDKKKVYLKTPTYLASSPQAANYTLKKTRNDIVTIKYNSLSLNDTIIHLNEEYILEKGGNSPIQILFGEGWYNLESQQNNKWRWTGVLDYSTLQLQVERDVIINMSLFYFPLSVDDSIAIFLDNNKITDCNENDHCIIDKLEINKGKHTMMMKPKNPPDESKDPDRNLSVAYREINIEPIKFLN